MNETFDAVLAEGQGRHEIFGSELTAYFDRLAAAHAAEVAERDARIAELMAHAADRESKIETIKFERQKAEDEAEASERKLKGLLP